MMSAIYDNWERLVAAAVKKQQLWELFHAPSRTPSTLSEASDFSSSSRHHDEGSWWPEEPPKLVLLSEFSPAFDFKHVSAASAELLGTGTFGSAYATTMDNGVRVVVKRLKSGSMSDLDFKHHMDIVGNVRHANVAPLRAYYASGNERILLYDFYSDGSVYALLHGQNGENRAQVSWETRRTIAIGAARAIAEIHKKNGRKLVHGNIKASNIFLSQQVYCCVSDMGLANVIETAFMPKAWCYAPEIKNTRDVSQASDVYSFGILLLELLTRKSSIHVPGGPEAVDLVKLVRSKRVSKVFDGDMLQYPTIKNDMIDMLQVGIKCVANSMKKRPKMFEVVKMLEDIFETNPISNTPREKELVFLKDVIHGFDLQDLLRASAQVLGYGTFWTSYKVILQNGNTIVIKRLKDVAVKFKAFQEHMKVFGQLKHKNIADPMAYFFSKDETLIMCHYYHRISVYALLHGRRGTTMAIDWKTRLKIAVDVASGIAHIHGEDGGKLVHGNIRSSNIFFLEHNYFVVADAGNPKLSKPIKPSASLHPGYYAPEVTDTWKVSQASDVYNFGVFLVELASGLPLHFPCTPDDLKVISLVEWFQSIACDKWITEVFDNKLLMSRNGEEEAGKIQFLQIAMDCVNIDPQSRPGMSQVVKMLEEINGTAPSVGLRLEDAPEEESQPSNESRLERILEDMLLPTLTQ